MADLVVPTAIAFGAVFVAEFGDKSQLIILAFATRYAWRPVVAGVVIAAALIQGISVAIGALVGAALPETAVGIVAGLAFLGVAAWTLRSEPDDDEGVLDASRRMTGPAVVAVVAGAFIAAELGDKTMIATFALAASQGPLPTWVGSTLGEVAANLVAVAVGHRVGTRLPARTVRIGSAVLFALAGVLLLASAVLEIG